MNNSTMSIQITFVCCFVVTQLTLKFDYLMARLHVCNQITSTRKRWITIITQIFSTLMIWSNVSLKRILKLIFKLTILTLIFDTFMLCSNVHSKTTSWHCFKTTILTKMFYSFMNSIFVKFKSSFCSSCIITLIALINLIFMKRLLMVF